MSKAAVVVPSFGFGGCESYAVGLTSWLSHRAEVCLLVSNTLAEALPASMRIPELRPAFSARDDLHLIAAGLAEILAAESITHTFFVSPLPVAEEDVCPDPILLLDRLAGAGDTTVVFQLCHRVWPVSDKVRRVAARLIERQRWIAVSTDNRRKLAETFGIDGASIEVIPNGTTSRPVIKPSPADVGRFHREFSVHADSRVVVGVGRLVPSKRWKEAISALARLSDRVLLLLIGDGPGRADLEKYAALQGVADRVRFAGFRSDVPRLLALADAFVFPSRAEGASFALLEAMAARLAIVASRHGSNGEMIRDGQDGLLYDPGDWHALAAHLETLLNDTEVAQRLAGSARARAASRYSEEEMFLRTAGRLPIVPATRGVAE